MEIYNLNSDSLKTITNLKPAARNDNRVNVFVDNEFAFSLDLSQVVEFKLKVGKKITNSEIEKLKRASSFGKLYMSTLEWVFLRPRSTKEVREHLHQRLSKRKQLNKIRKNNQNFLKEHPELHQKKQELKLFTSEVELFSDEDIENVVQKLIEKKYIDDFRFAEYYVENRCTKKGISKRRLYEELIKKGISSEIVDEVLNKSKRNPEEEIKKVILKKKNKYDSPQKLLNYILRQGFPYDISRTLVDSFFSNPDEFSLES